MCGYCTCWGIETVYQIYRLTVIDATIRGLKHPKLWGLLASNGNNSSGLLLYLIGRRNYPINSIDSNQKTKMIQRKKQQESLYVLWL
ncbi:MAG: hypothetical protein ACLR43_01720 [Faecalibacillus faecis]